MTHVKITDRERDTLPGAIASLGADTGTDLTLVCRDGTVHSYQALFAWSSSTLRKWFLSHLLQEIGGKRKEEMTLLLPDLGITSVSVLASFLLTGQINIRTGRELRHELELAWQLLAIDRIAFKTALVGERGGSNTVRQQKQVLGGKMLNLGSGIVLTPPLAASTPARPTRPFNRIPSTLLNNDNVSVIREAPEKEIEVIDVTGPPGPQQIVFKSSTVPTLAGAQCLQSQVARGLLRARLAPKAGVHKKRPLTVPITTDAGRLLPGVTATALKPKSKEHLLRDVLAMTNIKTHETDTNFQNPSAKQGRGRPRKSTEDVQSKAPVRKTVPVVVAKAKARELAKEVVSAQRKSQRIKPAQGSLNEEALEQKSLAKANAKMEEENRVKNIRSLEEEQVDEPSNDNLEEEDEGLIVEEVRIQKLPSAPLLGPDGQLSCYICKQDKDDEGRTLNIKNMFFVRSHLSKCLYATGKLFSSIPPGDSNTNSEGGPIDEQGVNGNWYHCQVKDCWLAEKAGEAGQLCYKVLTIGLELSLYQVSILYLGLCNTHGFSTWCP